MKCYNSSKSHKLYASRCHGSKTPHGKHYTVIELFIQG
jgi:hypothetical protein